MNNNEENILIQEFLELDVVTTKSGLRIPIEFDKDWNSFMVVLDKIVEIWFSAKYDGTDFSYYYSMIDRAFSLGNHNRKKDTYEAALNLIKWYNENKKE